MLNGQTGKGGRRGSVLHLPEVPPAEPTDTERAAADRVLERYPAFRREQLLPLLQEVQKETAWISEEMTRYLSKRLEVPFADLYGVISFYGLLHTKPVGRTVVRVCNGVPCVLRGARGLGQHLEQHLGVGPGTPTPDGAVSWEWFPCLGQCDHAPAVLVGDQAIGNVTSDTLDALEMEKDHDNSAS